MANYQETRFKLRKTQIKKIKSAAKYKTGTIPTLNKKNFEDEYLSRKLLLTTRQTTKVRNAFANNMSVDIKLSKTQISKKIKLGRFFGSWLGNLGKKALTNIDISLSGDNLPGLLSNLTSNAINKFERKIIGKRAVTAGKGFTFINKNNCKSIFKKEVFLFS